MAHVVQNNPLIIPAAGGKLIEEHFGRISSQEEGISIARMEAPPGWSEPFQTPEFDEWTLVYKGKKQIEVDGDSIVLLAGQSILVRKGSRVRYSNPFEEECEYWSICVPAFSIDTVNREDE
ncbi:cupin domain-containing protein [Desertivirga arenae]|uniref:cupin domain-containing protein n=1 Tax=Desertivirga arenae TaxID=2810309 RepID=UPI001A95D102|nr:cupin domain-containing protein [Pedobacter sp. SYSU D00823]